MPQTYRNIYQIARESTGYTQEKAAELLDISVESLRAYETGIRVPPDKKVIKMIEIYDARYLAYQHLKTSAEVGQTYLPNINITDLPTAVLRLQKEVSDLLKCEDAIVEITCYGSVSKEKHAQWECILKEMDDIVEAIMSVKFSKHG